MQRRKARRFKQWNKTKIRPAADAWDPAAAAEIDAFTYDLSLGGARIHSKERFETGALLRLRIELVRSRDIVNVEGRVRWVRPGADGEQYEMGVEFDHAAPQAFMSLMKNLHDERVVPSSPDALPAEPGRKGFS
jgi:c-di-GMP-binding flagellar brake protein YcgR